jgi:MoxR-like ATPase
VTPGSVGATAELLGRGGYVADQALATTVHLALRMGRPLFLEGEPGTGKTEIAKVLAAQLPRRLVRLQCYDGMDLSAAAYEWNYSRQLMAIRVAEATGAVADIEGSLYDRKYLEGAPLAPGPRRRARRAADRRAGPRGRALRGLPARTPRRFPAHHPELGTLRAHTPPVVVITSNRTREVHDAIRRRCLYHWVDYPDAARERAILRLRAPGVSEALSAQVVAFVQKLREGEYFKLPGVAESIDWANALAALDAHELEAGAVDATLGVLLKYQDDIAKLKGEEAAKLVAEARQAAP